MPRLGNVERQSLGPGNSLREPIPARSEANPCRFRRTPSLFALIVKVAARPSPAAAVRPGGLAMDVTRSAVVPHPRPVASWPSLVTISLAALVAVAFFIGVALPYLLL